MGRCEIMFGKKENQRDWIEGSEEKQRMKQKSAFQVFGLSKIR